MSKQVLKKAYMPQSKSQTHITPDRIYEIISQEWGYAKDSMHDPCPAYTPYKSSMFFNGLYGDLHEVNYINPPYHNLSEWVMHAVNQTYKNKKTVMLLPAKTDQSWFHILINFGYKIKWIHKRLRFKNNKHHSTQPHFLVLIK